jgi:hypothetical protein
MRTERALDRLRAVLARRGIASTAAALAAAVSTQPLISAPAGLATSLAVQALAAAGAGTFAATLTSLMTAKIVTTAGVSAVLAFAIGTYVGFSRSDETPPAPPFESPRLAQTIAALRSDKQRLQTEVAALGADLVALKAANVALASARPAPSPTASAPAAAPRKSPTLGLARHEVQQAVLNNLRQIAAARDQFRLEKGRAPESVETLVGRGRFIKTVRTVGGEDYSALSMTETGALTVTTPDGIEVTYDPTGEKTTKPDVPPEIARVQELGRRVDPTVNKALAAFRAANNGANPANEQALLPYFATPQEGADFVEFVEARKAAGGP